MSAIIEARGLVNKYGDVVALDGPDLTGRVSTTTGLVPFLTSLGLKTPLVDLGQPSRVGHIWLPGSRGTWPDNRQSLTEPVSTGSLIYQRNDLEDGSRRISKSRVGFEH